MVQAQLREPVEIELAEGQRITVAEQPVRRAAVYVPGGRAPYPSTVVMGAVTARAAGVGEIAVCAPPGPGGRAHPVILAACVLCEVSEVYRMGGAQAIAALAYGTESVAAVDVIAGPGNAWVQEAKRQVAWTRVGIDGIAGPSELVVVAAPGCRSRAGRPRPARPGRARRGEPAVADLDFGRGAGRGGERRSSASRRDARARPTRSSRCSPPPARPRRLELAERIAPEHLELVGEEAEALAGRVRRAGCLFVGAGAATAFGDYVAGSNHVLPTGGAARFQSALSASTFRRRMAHVSLPGEAPGRLAPAGAALARAEGFPVHAESMERRA